MEKGLPRGIRNNNPLNIRKNIYTYMGEINYDTEKEFKVFIEPVWGIRAAFKILQTYKKKYKINTIEGIINRWAPPNENNTKEYINYVVYQMNLYGSMSAGNYTKYWPSYILRTKFDYCNLVRAMIMMECGAKYISYYSFNLINKAFGLAQG